MVPRMVHYASDVKRFITAYFPGVKVTRARRMPDYWDITVHSKRQTAEEKDVEQYDIEECVYKKYGDARVTDK